MLESTRGQGLSTVRVLSAHDKADHDVEKVRRKAVVRLVLWLTAATFLQSCSQTTREDAPDSGEADLVGLGEPSTYLARRAGGAVTIDGHIEEPAWAEVPWTSDFIDIRGPDWPTPPWVTQAKLMWDEHALYVAARLEEPHVWATLSQRDAIVWREDDFEVFLDPDGDGLNYFEIEVNALGTVLDLFLERPYNKGGSAIIDWDLDGLLVAVNVDGTANEPSDIDAGWNVEMAIPWDGLTPPENSGGPPIQPPTAGDEWRVNFSRVDWPLVVREGRYVKERELVDWNDHPENNWVWSPQGRINMHVPEMWGRLVFCPALHGTDAPRHCKSADSETGGNE